jgi:hypothetical protein
VPIGTLAHRILLGLFCRSASFTQILQKGFGRLVILKIQAWMVIGITFHVQILIAKLIG